MNPVGFLQKGCFESSFKSELTFEKFIKTSLFTRLCFKLLWGQRSKQCFSWRPLDTRVFKPVSSSLSVQHVCLCSFWDQVFAEKLCCCLRFALPPDSTLASVSKSHQKTTEKKLSCTVCERGSCGQAFVEHNSNKWEVKLWSKNALHLLCDVDGNVTSVFSFLLKPKITKEMKKKPRPKKAKIRF